MRQTEPHLILTIKTQAVNPIIHLYYQVERQVSIGLVQLSDLLMLTIESSYFYATTAM